MLNTSGALIQSRGKKNEFLQVLKPSAMSQRNNNILLCLSGATGQAEQRFTIEQTQDMAS